jgi:hypothetical protein
VLEAKAFYSVEKQLFFNVAVLFVFAAKKMWQSEMVKDFLGRIPLISLMHFIL